MTDYPRRKRPPKNKKSDYIVRALSRLLDKYLKNETNDSTPYKNKNYNQARGPRSSGYRGSSGNKSAYSPRNYMRYKPSENAKPSRPNRPEPNYPRESKPMVQSLPQPRHESDIEELLRRLEESTDDKLVEKVLQRLEDESRTIEKAVTADPDKTGLEDVEQDASVDAASKTVDAKASEQKEPEKNGLEAMTEPLSHEDELEGKIETGELDWLNDELDETFVELTDLKEEAGLQEVLVLEKTTEPMEQASHEHSIAPTPEVGPELHPFGPEPPLAEIIDPVMKLESDIEEAEEEGGPV